MIKKGSLVRFVGSSGSIPNGKLLTVTGVNGDSVVVWVLNDKNVWKRKTIKSKDVEEVVE